MAAATYDPNSVAGDAFLMTNMNGTAHRMFYADGSGDITELAHGTSGQVLTSNGATSAPSWQAAAGGGNVSNTGTPADNQIAVWTNSTTIEGDSNFTYDGTDVEIIQTSAGANTFPLLLRNNSTSANTSVGINFAATTGGGPTGFIRSNRTTGLELSGTTSTVHMTIDSSGNIDLVASANLSWNGTDILADSAGTMTLSNIDALDATTESTIESAIDTLSNLTSASALVTVGTITSGTWNSGFGATATENIEDIAGPLVATGGTKTGITVTYQDSTGDMDFVVDTASTSTSGIVELATAAETTTGTDTGRAVTPDGLAGSDFGIRYAPFIVFDFTTDTATGDGKFYFHIPPALDGMNLVYVHAEVITAGTTGTTDIQIHNVDNALDMLSTKLTIDSGETGSDTAATAAVINTSNDHVNTNDVLRVDVDAVSTTAAQGLIVTLGFQLP
jgi:hypothetical protein